MAHAHSSEYAQSAAVSVVEGEIWIACGSFSIRMERNEAAHLTVDLLNAVEATPADVEQAA